VLLASSVVWAALFPTFLYGSLRICVVVKLFLLSLCIVSLCIGHKLPKHVRHFIYIYIYIYIESHWTVLSYSFYNN
jgi:hypothetical protein